MAKKQQTQKRKKPLRNRERRESARLEPVKKKSSVGRWVVLLLLGVVVGVLITVWLLPASDAQLIEQVREADRGNQYSQVVAGVAELRSRKAANAELLLKGARASQALNSADKALEFLDEIDDRQGIVSLEARTMAAEIEFSAGRAKESEEQFRRALAIAPNSVQANRRLAKLLNVLGRRYEAAPYLMQLLKGGTIDLEELVLLANRHPNYDVGDAINLFIKGAPDDPRANLSKARKLIQDEHPLESLPILEEIVRADPENVEAWTWLGKALWALDNAEKFADWHSRLPKSVEMHPDYWLVLGLWAQDHNQPRAAMRCYWETLKRDPDVADANYRLGKMIERSDEPGFADVARQMRQRSVNWPELEVSLEEIMKHRNDLRKEMHEKHLQKIAALLEDDGRSWEAFAWYRYSMNIDPNLTWAVTKVSELQPKLTESKPRYLADSIPALKLDFSGYPLPNLDLEPAPASGERGEVATLNFVDEAQQAGIDFQFFNGAKDERKCVYMYQLTGGGVGVLDFNLDGLPDFYAAQGCDWPIQPEQTKYLDQLYLNMGNGRFREVSQQARVSENGFGQSVTIGDYNVDGFPDVYVANIGGNRLLCNNGDGTYSDVSEQAALTGADWTAACALVDLDGDQLPDLFDVNYLGGPDVFTRTCQSPEGKKGSCFPRVFDPTQDQVWLNLGDGRFQEQTAAAGLPKGKGLGIVAGDINHDRLIDIFVGNDGEANFLLVNQSRPSAIAFAEMASAMGVDFDASGNAQACMGIAVADVNGDEKIDYFVTNFLDETNSLYLSNEAGFAESSRQANLSAPGFELVGFGTQFLDVELDGDEDLMITNGHVQDHRAAGGQYEMPPLLLLNTGTGKFDEYDGKQAGEFFQQKCFGRGMARLDWNRDGLNDLLITSLDRPLVLLTNKSAAKGGFISLRLIGTDSNRDAIGTNVWLYQGDKVVYQQLTAGDGYAASNQRELVFAAGAVETLDRLEIEWPTGKRQTFTGVQANRHYIALEGTDELIPCN